MPLQLGGVETLRPQVIVWDPNSERQIDDAKERVERLLRQGFSTVKAEYSNGEVILRPPPKDENIGVFRVLSDNGDDRIIWDRRDKNQVKEAFAVFKKYMDKGYTAYVVNEDGSHGHKITEFDPGLEEIIMNAGEAILVPKTKPG